MRPQHPPDDDKAAYQHEQWLAYMKEKNQPQPFADTDSHPQNRYTPADDPQAEWEDAMKQ